MREEEAGGSGKPALGHCLNYSPSLTPPHPCATKRPLMDNPSIPRPDIDAILNPGSIAVVGASTHPAKQGHTYVSALREFGFQGQVYPINPKAEEVAGYTCYPSLKDVPGPVDYVISAVPAPLLPQVMKDASGKQVKGIHLFTARMAEMATEEGLALEAGIIRSARELGARIIGPNCMGLYNPRSRHLLQTKPPEATRPRGIPQPERRKHG